MNQKIKLTSRGSKIFPLILSVLLLALQLQVFSQNNTLIGKITDASTGQPVVGANVRIKGSTKGVETDVNGAFKINASTSVTLIISYIGYTEIEVLASSSLVNIRLTQSNKDLDDVVVVGYGTTKKASLTGSVSTVSAKAFQDRGPVDNPLSAMQGQVPGMVITRSSSAPGREAWSMQIRGATSTNGSDPLVIVDGIPLVSLNALNSINPSDIENISVLKDASAAIYGARAAGGVVLITTKTAKAGSKVNIQYDGSVSSKVLGLMPHLLNVKQYGQSLVDATTNDYYGIPPTTFIWYKMGLLQLNAPDSGYMDMNYNYNMDWSTGKLTYIGTPISPSSNGGNPGFGDVKDFQFFNTNYADMLWGNSASTQHNISFSGRNEKSGYRLSFGYLNDGSPLKWGNNSNSRYNIRFANDYKITDKLKVETNISLEKNDIIQPTNTGYLGQYQQPGFPVAAKNGKPYAWGTQYSANWQAALGGDAKEFNTRIFTSLKATYAFTKHLQFIGQGSYNANFTDLKTEQNSISWWNYAATIQAADNPTQQNSFYQRQLIKDPYYNLNGYFNYQNTFKVDHSLGITLGSNYERDEANSYTAKTTYLANNSLPSLNLGIGDNTTKTVTESQSHYAIGSFFSRLNYGYKGKYLFEANARYDGSSKFNPDNRWKLFYGLSAAWRVTEEKFMQHQNIFNELKLRTSWGSVGNQNGIGLYDYIQLLNVSATGGATSSGFPIIGSSPLVYVGPTSSLVSLNRTWETVQIANLAVDFSTLKNRLSGTVEYFVKNNINMLLGQTFPSVLGATAPAANIGHLRTWGWEGLLMWRDKIGKLTYHVGGTVSDNQNKLVYFGGANVLNPGLNGAVQGYSLNTYFGLQYAGRVQDKKTADAVNALNTGNNINMPVRSLGTPGTPGVRVGDNYFTDVNGDGKLTTPGDLVKLGRDDPRYVYSVNLGIEYKGFDFSIIFQGVGKRTVFRNDNWRVPEGSIFQGQSDFWYGKTWTPSNTGAYYPILGANQNSTTYNTYNYQISNWSVENGAYVRLKNLVLGYTLSPNALKKAGIQRLRIYFSGENLWEKTHIHDGWDPEATKDVGRANNASSFQRYPFQRYLTFGVNVTL